MTQDTRKTNNSTQGKRIWRSRWKKIVSTLAAITVFCTTYALILPAITVNSDTYCGKEEHTHSDDCYTMELICGLEEGAVSEARTETITKTVIESVLVDEGHVHGDACYTVESNLVCGIEESEAEVDEDGNVISEGHTHTEACYEEVRTLTCGQEERDPVYEEKEVEVEEVVEIPAETGHVHTEECYKKTLTCTKEEHEHSDECFSNPTLDLETAADWEKTLPKEDELTGVWAEDVLTIAKSQLGYRESSRNFKVYDGERKGYTRYGAMFGVPYGDWCAMFIQFCMHYAEVDTRLMPASPGVPTWVRNVKKIDNYFAAEEYVPNVGDIVFFDWDSKPGDDDKVRDGDHIGLVAEVKTEEKTTVDGEKIEVPTAIVALEGNSKNEVRYNTYKIDDESLMGYAVMPEKPESEEELQKILDELEGIFDEGEEESKEELDPTMIVELASFTESGVQVNFTAPYGVFPVGTLDPALNVVEILPGTPEYEAYKKEAAAQVEDEKNQVVDARFFDITIVDIDGNEVHLLDESLAKVEIIFPQKEAMAAEGEVDVVHFAEEGTEVLTSEAQVGEEVEAITFDTPSFSVFGVVIVNYTVDFYYTVPGTEDAQADPVVNEYHMKGGTTMLMSDLFVKLGIDKDAADIVSVDFTDTSLVEFNPINNDYEIVSLVPFQTSEALTIVFEDGSMIVIGVEDEVTIYSIETWRALQSEIAGAIASGETDITITMSTEVRKFGVEETITIPSGVKVTINFVNATVGRAISTYPVNVLPTDDSKRGPFFDVAAGGELVVNGAHFTGYAVPVDSNGRYQEDPSLASLETSAISPNKAAISGKGIYINSSGTVTLKNSSVKETYARRAPAPPGQTGTWTYPLDPGTIAEFDLHDTAPIVSHAGNLTVENTVFEDNYLYERGVTSEQPGSNAAAIIAKGNLTVKGCPTITNSVASGGIIIHSGGTGLIENSTINNCRVDGTEAAPIVSKSGSTLTLRNTNITNNIAQYPHWQDDGSTVVDKEKFDAFFTKMTSMSLQGGTKNRIESFRTGGYFYGKDEASQDDLPDSTESQDYQEAYMSAQYSSDGYLGNDPIRTAGALLVNGGTVVMEGNSAMQNNLADHGAVLVTNGGTFTMKSGEISGNKGYHAGAVGIASKSASEATSTFNFEAGTISSNATIWYGTVTVSEQNSRFTMGQEGGSPDDTVISSNFSLHKGGAIYINSNDTSIKSGKLYNNTAAIFGGGIYLERYRKLQLESTEITNNEATSTLNSKAGVLFSKISGADETGFVWYQKYWANLGAGLGGGFWSCPTGRTHFDNYEVALHDNRATSRGEDFSVRDHADELDFYTNQSWKMTHITGTPVTTNPTDPQYIEQIGNKRELNFKNNDADPTPKDSYSFIIIGNESPCGGGIASNGDLYLMKEITEVEVELEFEKKWNGATTHGMSKDVAVSAKLVKTNNSGDEEEVVYGVPAEPQVSITIGGVTVDAAELPKSSASATEGAKNSISFPQVKYSNKHETKPGLAHAYEQIYEYSSSYGVGTIDIPVDQTTGENWKLVITEYIRENASSPWTVASQYNGVITQTKSERTYVDDVTTVNTITHKQDYVVAASLDNTTQNYDLEVDKVDAAGDPLNGVKFTLRTAVDSTGVNSVTLLGTASNGVTAEYAANKKYSLSQNTGKVPLVPGTVYSLWETPSASSGVASLGLDIAFKLGDDGKPQLIATDDPVRAIAETRKLYLCVGDLNHDGDTRDADEDTSRSDAAATKYWEIYDGLVENGLIALSNDGLKIVVQNYGLTSHEVTKTWNHGSYNYGASYMPSQITFELRPYDLDGNPTEIVYSGAMRVTRSSPNWGYTWTDLPIRDIYGNPVTYRVVEDGVSYFLTSYSYSGTSIQNTGSNGGEITGWQDCTGSASTVAAYVDKPVRILVNGNKAIRVSPQGTVSLVDATDPVYYEETLLNVTGSSATYGADVTFKAVRKFYSGGSEKTNTWYLASQPGGASNYRYLSTFDKKGSLCNFNYWINYGRLAYKYNDSEVYSTKGNYYINLDLTNQHNNGRVYIKYDGQTGNSQGVGTVNVKLQEPVRSTAVYNGATTADGGRTNITNSYSGDATGDIMVIKKEGVVTNGKLSTTNTILPGAEFTLSPVQWSDATNRWEPKSGDKVPNSITLVTNDRGYAKFEGIRIKTEGDKTGDVGYWMLTEKSAPNGYMSLGVDQYIVFRVEMVEVTSYYKYYTYKMTIADNKTPDALVTNTNGYVDGGLVEEYASCCYHYKITLGNIEGGEPLPETGGIGTTIIYILGAVLVIGAGILLIVRKKNKN